MRTGIGQKDAGLTVGDLAQLAAILALDPDRVGAFFGEITAIHDEHALGIVHIDRDLLPVAAQDGRIVPSTAGQELLHAAHSLLACTKLGDDDGFDRFPFQRAQQAVQVALCPSARLAAAEACPVDRVVGAQHIGQVSHIGRHQFQQGNGLGGHRFLLFSTG
ncbi:MAG: hypothetical protein SNJ51_18165 [Roseiflexus sp.]